MHKNDSGVINKAIFAFLLTGQLIKPITMVINYTKDELL